MASSLSEFFSNLYTICVILISYLLLEAITLFQALTMTKSTRMPKRPMAPVVNYLALVEEKHPAITYKMTSRAECAVCLSKIELGEKIRELHCRHLFHKDCVDRWLEHDCFTCPLCRRLVVPDEIVTQHHRLQTQQANDQDDQYRELLSFIASLHDNLMACGGIR